MVRSKFVMEIVAIVTVLKLLMYQIENFVIFIDYGDVDVIVKPNESDQMLSETVRKLSIKLSTQLRICKTVNKR